MPSLGPNAPSNAANDSSVGTVSWGGLTNSIGSNNFYSTCTLTTGNTVGYYLKHTGYGFSVPSGATIDGIVIEYEANSNTSTKATWLTVKSIKGGTIGGNNNGTGADLPASDTYVSFGSSSDLWGQTWSHSDINASNFGFAFSPGRTGPPSATARIDHSRATVYYTVGSTYTLTAAVGACSLSGQAASLEVGRVAAAAAGSFALSGQAAALLAGRLLAIGSGAIALAGNDAALAVARTMSAAFGSFNMGGQDAAYARGFNLVAGAGDLAIAGQTVELRRSFVGASDVGAFTLAGQQAAFARGRMLMALVGEFLLEGQSASLGAASQSPRVVISSGAVPSRLVDGPASPRVFAGDAPSRVVDGVAESRVFAGEAPGRII